MKFFLLPTTILSEYYHNAISIIQRTSTMYIMILMYIHPFELFNVDKAFVNTIFEELHDSTYMFLSFYLM